MIDILHETDEKIIDEVKHEITSFTNNLDKKRMLEYLIDNIRVITLEDLELIVKKK